MNGRAVAAASGYALRADDSANRINYLPDHHFAQLDAHNYESARAWSERLWDRHRIAVPVGHAEGRLWVRISAQVYNDPSDFEALADAVSNP